MVSIFLPLCLWIMITVIHSYLALASRCFKQMLSSKIFLKCFAQPHRSETIYNVPHEVIYAALRHRPPLLLLRWQRLLKKAHLLANCKMQSARRGSIKNDEMNIKLLALRVVAAMPTTSCIRNPYPRKSRSISPLKLDVDTVFPWIWFSHG